ncbi:TetR/AcrR family transcriptional regulator [Streptomyces sp. NPDC058417]|uniref:TetR/AcrR family transcriptional regulator n=1 Tax=unclassified Streptomyces TaxID=2593676 RepID=UPI00364E01E5
MAAKDGARDRAGTPRGRGGAADAREPGGAGTPRGRDGAGTPRERYRAQVRAEIKERAWEQVADAGASALSLNAIAKQMGMSGPALYRYFSGRDDLITELVRDAYRSLADTVTAAGTPGPPDVRALAAALRAWALADPHRYFLVYGTPVPGYHAPGEITGIASEIMAVLLDAFTATVPAGAAPESGEPQASEAAGADARFDAHLAGHRVWAADHPAPPAALHRALSFWTRLHGVLSLELAGHFTGMGFDSDLFFTAEMESLLGPS